MPCDRAYHALRSRTHVRLVTSAAIEPETRELRAAIAPVDALHARVAREARVLPALTPSNAAAGATPRPAEERKIASAPRNASSGTSTSEQSRFSRTDSRVVPARQPVLRPGVKSCPSFSQNTFAIQADATSPRSFSRIASSKPRRFTSSSAISGSR